MALEIDLRQGRGEKVDRDEYARRIPDDGPIIDQVWNSLQAFADTERFADPATDRGAVITSHRYAKLTLYKRGGLGVLFQARDRDLHRDVVIKFIHERCRADSALLSQFHVESEVTSRLDHPGVVPVYGIGEDWEGQPFYVMRMIQGRELRQDIREYHEAGGPTDWSRKNRQRLFALLEHLVNACNTIAYAHDVGIVHCDLKPAYGETYVLDWGLAASFENSPTFVAANEPTIRPRSGDSSNSGQRGGTLGHISPEQLTGTERVAPASDVYSLGATLYEMLAGQPPFNGRSADVADKIRCGDFRRPRDVNRQISHRLEAISLKAMRLAPGDRYRTAKQLAADLKNWMRDDEVQAAPDNLVGRVSRYARRHRTVAVAVVLALLLVTAAGTTRPTLVGQGRLIGGGTANLARSEWSENRPAQPTLRPAVGLSAAGIVEQT